MPRTQIPLSGGNEKVAEHNLYDFRKYHPTTGNIFFVSSTAGSSTGTGRSPTDAVTTLDAAVDLCTAANGDVIYIMEGHAETVTSSSLTLDKSGITIIGLGNGLARPVFTFGAAASTVTVSAANIRIMNCDFLANFANVAATFTVGAAKDFWVDNCTFRDTSAILNFLSIVVTGATANAADGLRFSNNYVFSLPTTDGAVVSVLGNLNRLYVHDNFADKAATNDAGHFLTFADKVLLGARVYRNTLNVVGATNAAVGVFATGSATTNTGVFAQNFTTSLDTTSALFVTATLNFAMHENYMSGVVANSGTLFPAADNPG